MNWTVPPRQITYSTTVLCLMLIGGTALAEDKKDEILQQLDTLGQQLGEVGGQVNDNLNAIVTIPDIVVDKLPPAPPAPPARPSPAATTWIGVRMRARTFQEDSDRPTILQTEHAIVSILNAGMQTANVSCTVFNDNGNLLLDAGGGTRVLGRGQKGFCGMSAPVNDSLSGWILIHSDQPVLVDGEDTRRISDDRMAQIELYPIDCAGDATGLEFACQFVEGGGGEPF